MDELGKWNRFFFFVFQIIIISNRSIFDVFYSLQHQRFVLETKEREPEILFVGDSLISHLIYTDMWETMFAPLHPVRKSLLLPSPSKHTNTTLFVFIPVKLWHRWRPDTARAVEAFEWRVGQHQTQGKSLSCPFISCPVWIKSLVLRSKKWMLKYLLQSCWCKMIVFGAWQFSTLPAKKIK